ncbi:uncharacterized protein LOC142821023 [Pelodiscus sinensis]|uniref:uncharacterized protein LOC142821023 n=1 Tax=Pelodiscus sinensis TaxID=13735 RepID=UPI003F6C1BE8
MSACGFQRVCYKRSWHQLCGRHRPLLKVRQADRFCSAPAEERGFRPAAAGDKEPAGGTLTALAGTWVPGERERELRGLLCTRRRETVSVVERKYFLLRVKAKGPATGQPFEPRLSGFSTSARVLKDLRLGRGHQRAPRETNHPAGGALLSVTRKAKVAPGEGEAADTQEPRGAPSEDFSQEPGRCQLWCSYQAAALCPRDGCISEEGSPSVPSAMCLGIFQDEQCHGNSIIQAPNLVAQSLHLRYVTPCPPLTPTAQGPSTGIKTVCLSQLTLLPNCISAKSYTGAEGIGSLPEIFEEPRRN